MADEEPAADRVAADPVREQRARARQMARTGKRLGYGLFGAAILAFLIGVVTTFTGPIATLVIICLVAGSIVLLPAIIVAFGVRAADREDREQAR